MAGIDIQAARLTIDYTSKDFFSLVADLRQYVTDRFPDITDFNTASQVEMLIELFASVGDRLAFTQDKQANEAYIVTARRRRNILAHARGIGYDPATQKASTGEITATFSPAVALVGVGNDLLIPKGTIISTKEESDPSLFRLTEDIIIPVGSTSGTGAIKNSLTFEEGFETDFSPNQRFKLEETPFLDDQSIVITINAEEWAEVNNFLDSSATDKHYSIEVDEDDVGEIIFGDGINGRIPDNDIFVTYETGGGLSGNQTSNTITENDDEFISNLGDLVKISFNNANPTTGGADRESEDDIRVRAPRALKTLTRTIAREDFQINVEDGVAGVVRAIAFSINENPLIAENTAHVMIVPDGGGLPSISLKSDVETFLTSVYPQGKPIPLTMDLNVIDPIYKVISIKAKVFIDSDVNFSTAKQTVIDDIKEFFDYETLEPNLVDRTIDFGKTVRWSKVLKVIQNVFGVLYVQDFELNGSGSGVDISLNQDEIPELDDSNFDIVGGLEFVIA